MIKYFKDLLATLKQIQAHQAEIEKHLAKLVSTVSAPSETYPSLRTGKNQYEP